MIEHLALFKQVRKEWTPDRYCRNYFAVDAQGRSCPVDAARAVGWCVQGEFARLLGMHDGLTFVTHPAYTFLHAMARTMYPDYYGIHDVNNLDGHGATVGVLDACIAELERQREGIVQ